MKTYNVTQFNWKGLKGHLCTFGDECACFSVACFNGHTHTHTLLLQALAFLRVGFQSKTFTTHMKDFVLGFRLDQDWGLRSVGSKSNGEMWCTQQTPGPACLFNVHLSLFWGLLSTQQLGKPHQSNSPRKYANLVGSAWTFYFVGKTRRFPWGRVDASMLHCLATVICLSGQKYSYCSFQFA